MSRGLFNISIHQSVDSDFRAFWLASVTRNILGYSLFWDGIQNGFSFRDRFEKWDFCGKWSSCSNKYQERGKIWLVAVYWSVEKNFNSYWICNSIIKNDSRNTVNCNVNKLTEKLNYYPIFRRNVELYFFSVNSPWMRKLFLSLLPMLSTAATIKVSVVYLQRSLPR